MRTLVAALAFSGGHYRVIPLFWLVEVEPGIPTFLQLQLRDRTVEPFEDRRGAGHSQIAEKPAVPRSVPVGFRMIFIGGEAGVSSTLCLVISVEPSSIESA